MTPGLSEFVDYLPMAGGFAVLAAGAAIWRRSSSAALAVPTVFLATLLLAPYLQRLVTHVVEREGGGAASLTALSVFITGAIAYVVFLGQQYEISRGKTEEGLRQLSVRSQAIEAREAAAAKRETELSRQVQVLAETTETLDRRVRHETRRAVALSAIDNVLLDPTRATAPSMQILLGLLRSIVGRTTVTHAAFDSIEILVSLDECATRGVTVDLAVVRSVSRYLESLRELVTADETTAPIDEVLERLTTAARPTEPTPG